MGRTFRATTRPASKREPQQEEKSKKPEKGRQEREDRSDKKKSLRDACIDLKKEVVAKHHEQARQVKQVQYDAEYEQLLAEMYGPQIDPRGPLLKFEGQRIPKPVFEDLLIRTFERQKNRLPIAWESEKDYLIHCVQNHWVEVDDTAVLILSRAALQVEAA